MHHGQVFVQYTYYPYYNCYMSLWYIMALKVFSCNVKGLNAIQKRWIALKEFKSSKADVIMIQETNFRLGFFSKFASKHFPNTFVSSDPSGKARVAILIKHSRPIWIRCSFLNPHGLYVLLSCTHLNTSFNLANIYAPNSGHIGFLTRVFEKLQTCSQPFMVIEGDFNMCMSPTKDRCALFQNTPPIQAQKRSTYFCKLVWSNDLTQ